MNLNPMLEILIAIFFLCLAIWILLVIYKGRVEQAGDEVLRTTPERMTDEQKKMLQKVDRAAKPVLVFGILAVLFAVASVAYWLYLGLVA